MNIKRTIAAAGLGLTLALGLTVNATAATPAPAPPADGPVNTGPADQADRDRDAKARKGKIMGLHKGKKIDLAGSWGTATVCSEYPDLSVRCFDTDEQAQADMAEYAKKDARALPKVPQGRSAKIGPQTEAAKNAAGAAPSGVEAAPMAIAGTPTCAFGWVCIWEHKSYDGRKLQWSEDGTKTFGQYGFRDQTTSTCNNDQIGGMALIDYRDNMPDPEIITPLGGCFSNLANKDYPGWGTGSWNDRADALKM
ncbi:peptidase inhibitor family I36 protein [Streptomyces sp. NPDC059874]|uniref:peptidase inhibitor family I36 protein n=1 Tax=Streptomyces sp. NPDC059874 TaxID=3346983 RepID=UPI003665BC99